MVSIVSLWLPILLSAVLVFVASSIVHMLLKYHHHDFQKLPGGEPLLQTLRQADLPPGDYVFPYPDKPGDWQSPEMVEKYKQGPVGIMTAMRKGPPALAGGLLQWFVYSLVMGVLVAYVTGRTVAPTAEYLQVFRVAGAVAFIGYAGAHPSASIWYKRKWTTTIRYLIDGLLYALVTAGAFAGFWPD